MNIMKSIKEGPFQMGTVSDVVTGGTEGAVQQGPVRARVLNDLSAEEKERYKADIRATNILLQGIPKDIYSLSITILTPKAFGKMKSCGSKMSVEDTMRIIKEDHIQRKQCEEMVYWDCQSDLEDSDYFKEKCDTMHKPRDGAVLDEEQSLFLAGEQLPTLMR
ncbi:hypothetical protein Tco_1337317 [Tanacetum coccineum]